MTFDRASYTEFVEGDSNLPRLNITRVAIGALRRVIHNLGHKVTSRNYAVGLKSLSGGRWELEVVNLDKGKVVYTSSYKYANALHFYANNTIRVRDVAGYTKREAEDFVRDFMRRAGFDVY